jgi:phosphoglycolate phosphatase-like HAD superfamily hydrolase
MSQVKLPSWRPGATRDAIEVFLDSAEMLPEEARVAVFDVDGTLWCERPRYPQLEFLVRSLQQATESRPELADRPEYRAVLAWDLAAIGRLGVVNVVLALAELHAGISPERFESRVAAWFEESRHPDRSVPWSQMRYRPMLELIAELRARHFSVHLVTGTGTEFIRVVSQGYFGVPPESVAGSQVGYELAHERGEPKLLRTKELVGDPNEGPAKVVNARLRLGRRPILAAGNSPGDAELLAYTQAGDGPTLALLIEHDDAEREYAYRGAAASSPTTEPIAGTAKRMGWTRVSMQGDWATVFAAA